MAEGESLDLDGEVIEGMAEVTQGDIENARAWGRTHLPKPFHKLLDADAIDHEEYDELEEADDGTQ